LKYSQIIQDLKNKVYHPIYLLYGEEEFFIDQISDFIEHKVLDEAEKEFNLSVLYGLETDVLSLISAAKRFPMMASYNVIIVKEAQSLSGIGELATYVKNPSPTTILVLNHKHKKPDGRSEFMKLMKKQGVCFESKTLYENQVVSWIEEYLKAKGFTISPKSAQLIVENLGNSLSKITNELDKLTISISGTSHIEDKHIEENIGISKDYNVFELNNALGNRDVLKANTIINHFGKNPQDFPPAATLPMVYNFFSKVLLYHTVAKEANNIKASKLGVNPFFLKDYAVAARNYSVKKIARIISSLRKADTRSKGIGNVETEAQDLYKELVFEILH
tara:strand:+ start:1315 stop:2313 length:999 start_codon:yes stop_codon:yes gene_type:complete